MMGSNGGSVQTGIKKSLTWFFVLGISIQIFLGVFWMISNLTGLQEFSVTEEYVQAAKGIYTDEYQGVLYILLTALALGLEGLFRIPYFLFLYIFQLALAFCGGCFFLFKSGFFKGKIFSISHLWGSLFLLTIPTLMQSHLAVRPESLIASFFMLMLALCFDVIRKNRSLSISLFVRMAVLWGITSLLHPDYVWLGAVPMVFCLLVALHRKEGRGIFGVGLLVFFCMLSGVNGLNAQKENEGASSEKIQRSLGAAMVSRMVWPHFDTTYFFWPEEIQDVMSPEDAFRISQYADNVVLEFGPLVEGRYGRKQANTFYWQMAFSSLEVRTKEVIWDMAEDFKAYVFVPWTLRDRLRGEGVSFSGWNYKKMSEETPLLTSAYVAYGLYGFRTGLIVLFAWGILRMVNRFWRGSIQTLKSPAFMMLAGLSILSQAMWYTLSAGGMMDYMNVPIVSLLWYTVFLLPIRSIQSQDQESD